MMINNYDNKITKQINSKVLVIIVNDNKIIIYFSRV